LVLLRIETIDLPHKPAEVGLRRFQEQMVLITQQTESMHLNVQSGTGFCQTL